MMSSKTNARAGFQASRGEHRMYASYFFGENTKKYPINNIFLRKK